MSVCLLPRIIFLVRVVLKRTVILIHAKVTDISATGAKVIFGFKWMVLQVWHFHLTLKDDICSHHEDYKLMTTLSSKYLLCFAFCFIGDLWSWKNGSQLRNVFWHYTENICTWFCWTNWRTKTKEEERWSKDVFTEPVA